MGRITMYRIQINSESLAVGEPIMWTHQGQQWCSTANRPQAGLLFRDEVDSIKKSGFDVEIIEEFEFEELA